MARIELRPTAMVAGGDALAHETSGRPVGEARPKGKVVFVTGALPGEVVLVEVDDERRDFARGHVIEVVDAPSPDRVAPPCVNVAAGCGGCGWQHVALDGQVRWKEAIVADALRRIARLDGEDGTLPTISTVPAATGGYRTTLRLAVRDGRAAFHEHRGHGLVDAAGCLVAHPSLASLLDAPFGQARRVMLRASVATSERVAWCRPTARGVELPRDVVVVDDRAVRRGHGAIAEEVAGRRFRISPGSFFQSGPAAASALARAVLDAVPPGVASVADLYAGVGLFAAVVGEATGAPVAAVETDPSAAADARVNLADLDATVVHGEVREWSPPAPVDLVVADPARPGLAAPGVAAVARSGAARVVLVSCDPASLARDTLLLAGAGYRLDRVTLVDTFPHTPHVEAVAVYDGHFSHDA